MMRLIMRVKNGIWGIMMTKLTLLSQAQIDAWRKRMIDRITETYPTGHPLHIPPGPPLKWYQRIKLKIEWIFGFRIVHKDNINQGYDD